MRYSSLLEFCICLYHAFVFSFTPLLVLFCFLFTLNVRLIFIVLTYYNVRGTDIAGLQTKHNSFSYIRAEKTHPTKTNRQRRENAKSAAI